MLPDGRRLHLQHGPIDLIAEAWGTGRRAAYARAVRRFETVLDELVAELPRLRTAASMAPHLTGPVARRMLAAVRPHSGAFITPMAAVAGSVADEILSVIRAGPGIDKAYVNNGGDIALHLAPGTSLLAAVCTDPPARVSITPGHAIRGIATSGWRGRSQSLGIADSVTVLAGTAALADAAATLIANAVDLPGHRGIARQAACALAPDSDLGDRLVTTGVPVLDGAERDAALARGLARAERFLRRGLVRAAYLVVQGETRQIGGLDLLAAQNREAMDA